LAGLKGFWGAPGKSRGKVVVCLTKRTKRGCWVVVEAIWRGLGGCKGKQDEDIIQ